MRAEGMTSPGWVADGVSDEGSSASTRFAQTVGAHLVEAWRSPGELCTAAAPDEKIAA